MIEPKENIIDADKQRLFDWEELWRYRELFYFFTWRDVKIKYKQTVLGFFWALLQPLLMMLIFTVFFGRALNIPSQSLPYPVFVFSGLLVWNTFASGLTNAAGSMVNNASIIKKIYFPKLIIPASSILVALFDFIIAFILFIGLLFFFKQPVSWTATWCWPLATMLILFTTLGLGCWLSALNVKYRDVRYAIPFLIQILFFLTPVIYPVTMLKYSWLQYILAASPIYSSLEIFRIPLTGVYPNNILIAISVSSVIIFLLTGLLYFKRTENYFADLA